jgi:uncharacterized protein (TIGR03083 family)
VYAARELVDQVSELIESLTPQEWQQPSGCVGWRVQDVIAHLGGGAHQTVEPPNVDEGATIAGTAEQQMEAMVLARRTQTSEEIKQEYLDYAARSVDWMAGLQSEPVASTPVPILDLGTYPIHIFPDVVAFDHYCHLHVDVLAPFGPIDRTVPPVENEVLRPAIGWMLLGLPQMQGRDLDVLQRPLALELTGPGGGRWVLSPALSDAGIQVRESDEACPASVRSSAADFVRWATGRAPWRQLANLSGDVTAAEPFLDRLNII